MKNKTLFALAGLSQAMVCAGGAAAHAGLVGLTVSEESAPPVFFPPSVFRVYADFTGPTDRVNAWGGGGYLGPGIIQNVLADGLTPGSGFWQVGGAGGQLAPPSPGYPRDWDTYMTIGVRFGNEAPGGIDATALFPGTPVFIAGNTWTAPSSATAGVYITPDDDQGMAGYRVQGNDTYLRVLLMQLVVNYGEHVRGTIGVNWSVDGSIPSGGTNQNLTFSSIPNPAGWVMIAIGSAMMGARRRRERVTP